ncbi:MAG: hypothetical protein RL701_5226 [Pseudomonadota bacterium]
MAYQCLQCGRVFEKVPAASELRCPQCLRKHNVRALPEDTELLALQARRFFDLPRAVPAVGAILALALTLGVYLDRSRHAEPTETSAQSAAQAPQPANTFDYGPHTLEIRSLTARTQAEPCDRRAVYELTRLLFRAGDARAATQHADPFFETCGEFAELHSILYEAYMQLSEPKQAIAEVTRMLALQPHDASSHGRRGLAYEQLHDVEHAEQDYVQALAFQPRLSDVPISLANLYETHGRPCDAVAPLEGLLHYYAHAGDIDTIRARVDGLLMRPECTPLAGNGKASVRVGQGQTALRARVKLLGRETASFVVDTGASYVTITTLLAHRLGLRLDNAPKLLLQTANGVRQGALIVLERVELQGATALRVPAVVVDDLGPVDGLLGLSFLSRFDLKQSNGVFEISARHHAPSMK